MLKGFYLNIGILASKIGFWDVQSLQKHTEPPKKRRENPSNLPAAALEAIILDLARAIDDGRHRAWGMGNCGCENPLPPRYLEIRATVTCQAQDEGVELAGLFGGAFVCQRVAHEGYLDGM